MRNDVSARQGEGRRGAVVSGERMGDLIPLILLVACFAAGLLLIPLGLRRQIA